LSFNVGLEHFSKAMELGLETDQGLARRAGIGLVVQWPAWKVRFYPTADKSACFHQVGSRE
jgi:hypothetical protein